MNSKWMGLVVVGCLAGVAAPRVADACGLIIPVDGETASVDAQRVTMAYFPEENRTRVMAQIGYVGDLSNFSWIIPLPAEPTSVAAVGEEGAQLFAELDAQGEPSFTITDWTCALNNGGGDETPVSAPNVQVLQHGNTGAFDYVVLTGTGGTVVTDWLNEQGYATPDGMAEVVHTYIREGSVFMAMKVNLEALELGQIDPAISFDYEGWPGYPLRILRPTPGDEVEVILNVLAPTGAEASGEVVLQNIGWTSDLKPLYLDAIRDAGGWVVEQRGELRPRWVQDPETGAGEEVDVSRDLVEQVFGIPTDAPLILSHFHGIFDPKQLDEDTALNVSEDVGAVYPQEFSIDATRDEDCGWDEGDDFEDDWVEDDDGGCFQGSCGGGGGGGNRSPGRGGCTTTSGDLNPVLLLLLGLGLLRRRRRVR